MSEEITSNEINRTIAEWQKFEETGEGFVYPDYTTDRNALAEAIGKLSQKQRDLVFDSMLGVWQKSRKDVDPDDGAHTWPAYWLLFTCPCSTLAQCLAETIKEK